TGREKAFHNQMFLPCHFLFRYRYIVSGAKIAVMIADTTRTPATCCQVPVPCMNPRTAVAKMEIGLLFTNPCSQVGKVSGSTKTLLTKVNGMSTKKTNHHQRFFGTDNQPESCPNP